MFEKILCIMAAAALLLMVGTIFYVETSHEQVTVMVDLRAGEDPFQSMKKIVPSGTTITEIREINRSRNEYQMTVQTNRRKGGLLEWIKSSSRVERAEIIP